MPSHIEITATLSSEPRSTDSPPNELGSPPSRQRNEPLERNRTQPVLSLHSRIVLLKNVPAGTALGYGCTFTTTRASRIATIALGYADGLRRALSNNGRVLVRGVSAPIVGRVSMDLTIIDVTDVPDAALGDEVILIGAQNGARICVEDWAAQAGTISYEIVTGISARVPRVYQAGKL